MLLASNQMKQVFRMKERTGEANYAKDYYIQNEILSSTKSIKEKALREFSNKLKQQPQTIYIADLGCSSVVQNSLNLMYEFINTIDDGRRKLEEDNRRAAVPQEYQVYLNDLPRNDFNKLFRSIGKFDGMVKQKMENDDDFVYCFVNGVPGSFYDRIFPSNHLHFVHSSSILHRLSKIPEEIEDNKKNVWLGSKSPPNVIKAYYEQYKHDFLTFLRCRSKEVAIGGAMVLTLLGRRSNDPYGKDLSKVFGSLATALQDLVSEGLVEEEKLNDFDFAFYTATKAELEFFVEEEGSFTVNQVEFSEVDWETTIQFENSCISFDHIDFVKYMRDVVMEAFISNHFGEAIIEELFSRFTKILKVTMAKDEKNVFTNDTIWVTRKAQSNDVTNKF